MPSEATGRAQAARDVLGLANRARATVFYASPYRYGVLAKDESEMGLDGVRLAVSTADGLRAAVAGGFRQRFGLPLVQALGIIEVGLPVLNLVSAQRKPEALGRPGDAYSVWLRDEHGAPIEASPNNKPATVARVAYEVDDRFERTQWPTTPVHRDEGEQAMFDLIPLARPGWKVADMDREVEFVGEPL